MRLMTTKSCWEFNKNAAQKSCLRERPFEELEMRSCRNSFPKKLRQAFGHAKRY